MREASAVETTSPQAAESKISTDMPTTAAPTLRLKIAATTATAEPLESHPGISASAVNNNTIRARVNKSYIGGSSTSYIETQKDVGSITSSFKQHLNYNKSSFRMSERYITSRTRGRSPIHK